MKRTTITVVLWLSVAAAVPTRAQVVVHDPGHTVVTQLHMAMDRAHQAVVQLQWVKDLLLLKDMYLQSQYYYNWVVDRSNHKGGIVGYYKDFFDKEMQNLAAEEWRRISNEASTVSGETPVSRMVNGATDAMAEYTGGVIGAGGELVVAGAQKTDAGYRAGRSALFMQQKEEVAARDGMIQSSEQRSDRWAEMVRDLTTRAARPMAAQERESIDMQAALLQLQALADIRQNLNMQTEILNSREKRELAHAAMAITTSHSFERRAGSNGQRQADKVTVDQMVRELGRNPYR